MNADFEGQKKSEAAPEGPPHDLVHERGQKPAEAPQGNLAVSHKGNIGSFDLSFQAKISSDPKAHDLLTKYLPAPRLARYSPAASDSEVTPSAYYMWNSELIEAFQMPLHFAEALLQKSPASRIHTRNPWG